MAWCSVGAIYAGKQDRERAFTMISPQAKIVLGCVAFAIAASALTIWLVWALGDGTFAALLPLAMAGALALLIYTFVIKRKNGPPD